MFDSRLGSAIRITSLFVLSFVIMMAILTVGKANAQDALQGVTPSGLAPGSPAGSYSLSGFETINAYNGNLNFNLPLVSVGGRGGAGTGVNLLVEQKWTVKREEDPVYATVTNYPDYTGWTTGPRYAGAFIERRSAGNFTNTCYGIITGDRPVWLKSLTRLNVTMADGTELELRDTVVGGEPISTPRNSHNCPTSSQNRGKIFVTADGSAATFVSDSDITDDPYADSDSWPDVSGNLYLKDGSRWRFDSGIATEIRDRNGNKLSFNYSGTTTITDSLNRQVVITHGYTDGTYGLCDKVTYKGFGGASRTIYITLSSLSSNLRSGETIKTYAQLFPSLNASSGTNFNPTVKSAVILPNGKSYQFKYNSYGELARVVLPTGGAIEYDWDAGDAATVSDGGVVPTAKYMDYGVYRRVLERRTYADGSTLDNKIIYDRPANLNSNADSSVITETKDSSNNLLAKSKSYFYGNARYSFSQIQYPSDYSKWREGMEYKTESYAANGSSVINTVENKYKQYGNAGPSWWAGSADDAPANNPRLRATYTTLDDGSVALKEFDFDQYNNQTDVKEYNFCTASFSYSSMYDTFSCGTPSSGWFARRTHTDYVTSISSTSYANPVPTPTASPSSTPAQGTIHIRNLPDDTWVSSDSGGSTKVSRSKFEYDDYGSGTGHAGLTSRSSISGHDSGYTTSYTTRGNATATTRYLTPSTSSNPVTSYQQYDIAGNLVKIIDPEGNETYAGYSDVYGAPDGNATTNSAPTELSSVSKTSYAFATSVTNDANQTVYTQFDFYTGMQVDGQDRNGVISSGYSTSDPLDRPTQIKRAVGTGLVNQTTFAYDDTNKKVTTTGDIAANNDNYLKTESYYDGLGRTYETRRYEGSTTYILTTTTFDALGRVKRSYNPQRTTSATTDGYAENTYDTLGRITAVATSDGSSESSSYSGSTITVTDQAGKQRKSVNDALGRLTTLYEPDSGGTLNVNTDYAHDVLNNLLTVTQGSQTRTFVYDSLSRLTSAANPESGTIAYAYDGNGNLVQKDDARGVRTAYIYDGLNRITQRNYSTPTGAPSNYLASPNVTFTYDDPGVSYSAGRLTRVTNSNSTTDYTAFDVLGRVTAHSQTPNGMSAYSTSYTYNLAGALLEETYPSGRVVKNTISTYGDLSQVETKPSGGSFTTRANSFVYTAPGAVKSLQLGSGKYEHTDFNSRLQPTQIALGTSTSDTSLLKIDYVYGTSSTNNGNITSQTITVPSLAHTFNQTYTYDNLNRLATAGETYNGSSTWSQSYSYDRYGNRNISAGTGTTSLTFSGSSNKITTSGYAYDSGGNIISDASGKGFTYDSENNQTAVTSGGILGNYAYDGDGKRVKKYNTSSDDHIFIYDTNGRLIEERDLSGNMQTSYVYAGRRLLSTETAGPTTNYLTADLLGSPRINTDGSGNVTARHDYMPFGEEILTALTAQRSSGAGYPGGDGVRKKFTGYERDSESGNDFAQARYFGSSLGRFMSADPLASSATPGNPQTWNRYSYVGNNPLVMIDPTGEKAKVVIEIDTKKRTVKVTVTSDIAFYGEEGVSDEYRDRAAQAAADRIANAWSGGFRSTEGYSVTVNVSIEWKTVANKKAAEQTGMGNVVGLVYGNAAEGASSYVQRGGFGGPDYGRWNIGKMQSTWEPAHEYGHLLGPRNQSTGLMVGEDTPDHAWRATDDDYKLLFQHMITRQLEDSSPSLPNPESLGGARHNTRKGEPTNSTRSTTVWAAGRFGYIF